MSAKTSSSADAASSCLDIILSQEPFVDILVDALARVGFSGPIATIKNPYQWWTYTKGERA